MTETTTQEPDVLTGLRLKVGDLEKRAEEARKEAASQRHLAVNLEARRRAELGRGEDVGKTEKEIRAARSAAEMMDERAADLEILVRQAQCQLEDAERGTELEALQVALPADEEAAHFILAEYERLIRELGDVIGQGIALHREHGARAARFDRLAPELRRGWDVQCSPHEHVLTFAEIRDRVKQTLEDKAYSEGGRVAMFAPDIPVHINN